MKPRQKKTPSRGGRGERASNSTARPRPARSNWGVFSLNPPRTPRALRSGTRPAPRRLADWRGRATLAPACGARPSGGVELPEAGALELGDFEKNQTRMRSGEFRHQGLFLGSGVVQAGGQTVVGPRAKQSGRCWTEAELLAVLHARGARLGGLFDPFRDSWNHPAQAIQTLAACGTSASIQSHTRVNSPPN